MSAKEKAPLTGGKLMEEAKVIIQEVKTTPEEKLKLELRLRELINQHQQVLVTMEYEDRQSARLRELENMKSGSKNLTQNILAYAAMTAFFWMIGFILSHGLGKMDKESSFIIGNLTGMAAAITKTSMVIISVAARERWKPEAKRKHREGPLVPIQGFYQ